MLLLALAACSPKPTIRLELTQCGDQRTLNLNGFLKPGDLVDLRGVGGSLDFRITNEGKLEVPGITERLINHPYNLRYAIPQADGKHYEIQQNPDGDVILKLVCQESKGPKNPTPTPTRTRLNTNYSKVSIGYLRPYPNFGSKPLPSTLSTRR